jgi:putative transposase
MARTRYKIFENEYPYFVTETIIRWFPFFANPEVVKNILDSLEFMQKERRITLYAYVIMENHMHMVLSSERLSGELGDFKSFTARKIIDYYQRNGMEKILQSLSEGKAPHKTDRKFQFWQEGSHPQQMRTREIMYQKIEYIHFNPVRRGYVDNPVHWRYSSSRNYENGSGIISVCTDW